MSTRYLTNLILAVAGGFLVVATQAFSPSAVAWLTFGIAVCLTGVGIYMLVSRPLAQRIVGGIVVCLGAWTIVASLVFAPGVVLWLGFASACAFVGLGLAGLTIHELETPHVGPVPAVGDDRRAARQPQSNGTPVTT